MSESSSLFAVMAHANPTITDLVQRTGGAQWLGDVCDGRTVAQFATQHAVDVAMVSSDDPLAAGVVDALLAEGIPTVGPTRSGAQIEWDKAFSRDVVAKIAPESNPRYLHVRSGDEVRAAINYIGDGGAPVVVKPVGLAGGKGVKVVGPHLADNEAAAQYACEVIESGQHGGAVLIEERIAAPEFTIQAMTDGKTVVFPPATYDYPYRFDGDLGPGTGGMGSCTMPGGLLPFLDTKTYDQACGIVQDAVDFLSKDGRTFSGCMNAGFFATDDGLRVIEFNARFGDPEALNIMALFDGDWTDVMHAMAGRSLYPGNIPLGDDASVVVYLVAPEYAIGVSQGHEFALDIKCAEESGATVLFSAATQRSQHDFVTVGTSRAVAMVARDSSLERARSAAYDAIARCVQGDLQWRSDIASF